MSQRCNGVNGVFICEATGKIVEADLSYSGDYPNKEAFRGFEKIPAVLVPKIDIKPFLKTNSFNKSLKNAENSTNSSTVANKSVVLKYDLSTINIDTVTEKSVNNNESVLRKFSMVCNVNLFRDNLDKLKESIDKGTFIDNRLNMLKCTICNKEYQNERKLNNHKENKHMIIYKQDPNKSKKRVSFSDKVIIHELKEYHKCRKCTKIFEDYKSLKIHMKRWHKKRKCYICNYCTKKFVDRMFFKVHIKLHCDVCGLLSPNKKKYTEHKRNVCRIIKHYKCKVCELIFFRNMDLKDHSYDHTDVKYVCDICKDQCATKCGVAHHIKFLHSKKRPTLLYTVVNLGNDRLYLCNFCEESSVDRDFIENHTILLPDLKNRVMTSYENYYFCDHCFEKFDTETEMLQHKWTHFLKTEGKVQPKGILTNAQETQNFKRIYHIDELLTLPDSMKPRVVLEKIKLPNNSLVDSTDNTTDSSTTDIVEHLDVSDVLNTNKPLVDRKSKKTLLSKHRCPTCGKYYSSNYCLNRHIESQHSDYENLRCKVCEETFFWPSLLKTHKCIRLNLPEMPFDDARPEIHFDNLQEFTENGFDDFNIGESDDYINSVDFEIPAPIVEFHENVSDNFVSSTVNTDEAYVEPTYKLVMQEVPIEF